MINWKSYLQNENDASAFDMHFDELLKIVGEFGRFQKIRLFLICLFGAVCAFHAMNMVFVGAKPEYKCSVSNFNLSDSVYGNITEKEILTFLLEQGSCEIYSSDDIIKLLSSGNYTLEQIRSNNISISTEKCDNWIYSREVYGPTIVTQVCQYCGICHCNFICTTCIGRPKYK